MFNFVCPISEEKVDEHAARLNGFFTLVFVILAYPDKPYILLLLALDFYIRFTNCCYSPIACTSRVLLGIFKIKPKEISKAPKMFAAKIGFTLSILLFILAGLGYSQAALVVYLLFILASSLEAFFNFCLGCQVYTVLVNLKLIKLK